MKKFLIAAGVLGLMAAPAVAADLPRKAAPAPMYAPVPVMTWTGFYAGVNAGYGWASGGLDGFVGGGQLGYNWQSGALVFGLEGDFQGTAQDRSTALGGGFTATEKLPWFATVRGRLGYAAGPWLLYGTGGVAWVNYKVEISNGAATVSDNDTKAAWTLGAGVEYMFAPNWSTKLEYLYMDTGNTDVTLFGTTYNGRAKNNIVRAGLNYHF